jgi:hypothetical protein
MRNLSYSVNNISLTAIFMNFKYTHDVFRLNTSLVFEKRIIFFYQSILRFFFLRQRFSKYIDFDIFVIRNFFIVFFASICRIKFFVLNFIALFLIDDSSIVMRDIVSFKRFKEMLFFLTNFVDIKFVCVSEFIIVVVECSSYFIFNDIRWSLSRFIMMSWRMKWMIKMLRYFL